MTALSEMEKIVDQREQGSPEWEEDLLYHVANASAMMSSDKIGQVVNQALQLC